MNDPRANKEHEAGKALVEASIAVIEQISPWPLKQQHAFINSLWAINVKLLSTKDRNGMDMPDAVAISVLGEWVQHAGDWRAALECLEHKKRSLKMDEHQHA